MANTSSDTSGVLPNSVLFGRTVPPNSVVFGGTVPPNSSPLFYKPRATITTGAKGINFCLGAIATSSLYFTNKVISIQQQFS